ncbi:unnamed protein product, partial [Strongylus vulgaris]
SFEIAKRYAPKNEETILGIVKNGIFRGYAKEGTSSDEVVQERMIPDPDKAKAKEIATCINVIHGRKEDGQELETKINDITALMRQLSQSKANLMCITMDGHATLESAERMVQRANDWFHQMLDDLEKRIRDERRMKRRFRRHIKRLLKPVSVNLCIEYKYVSVQTNYTLDGSMIGMSDLAMIYEIVDKLCDLELLYETLSFLEKRMKVNEKTIAMSKENMRNARKTLAMLTALDYKRTIRSQQPPIDTRDYTLAAEVATAFHLLDRNILRIRPFIARSALASTLIDVVSTQMRGIHKAIVEEVCFAFYSSNKSLNLSLKGAKAFAIGVQCKDRDGKREII